MASNNNAKCRKVSIASLTRPDFGGVKTRQYEGGTSFIVVHGRVPLYLMASTLFVFSIDDTKQSF